MRKTISLLMVVLGFALQAVSYFALAAPLGTPVSPAYAEPRLPFAPLLFIVGVAVVFLSAVVYELMPDKNGK